MMTNANASTFPSVSSSLEQLSDADLLSTTRSLIGRSNQLLAALLAHLGEVEARGIHRTRACSSLYTYCIYDLRLSEDEAYRRVAAARLVRRFPGLFEAVANGELHLTGLLMLGPHLTEQNLSEVLARAKHRTKKEIARLVRSLAPMPDVPARIEPLGPAPARIVPPTGTWDAFMQSLCPVRQLEPGARPRDWVGGESGAGRLDGPDGLESGERVAAANDAVPAPARLESAGPTGPMRYSVQFTATEEYVGLLERAKALLSRALPGAALEEIQLRALRAYVAELEKKRYALTARPRARAGDESEAEPQSTREPADNAPARGPKLAGKSKPRRRGRYVPAAIRRAVFERDGGRCRYIDESGTRCRETHCLELHHVTAFAQGGEHSEENLELRCRAHNGLAAEEDFGREFIEQKRDALPHEPLASHERPGFHLPGGKRR